MSFEHLATIAKQTEEDQCSPNRRDHSKEIAGPPNYPLPFVPLTAVGGARRRSTHFNSSPNSPRSLLARSLARRRQRQRARNVERGSLRRREEGGRRPLPPLRAGNPSVMRRWRRHWRSAYCHQTCIARSCQTGDRNTERETDRRGTYDFLPWDRSIHRKRGRGRRACIISSSRNGGKASARHRTWQHGKLLPPPPHSTYGHGQSNPDSIWSCEQG